MDYIKKTSLDAEESYKVGVVGYNDGTTIIPVSTPDMTNSSTNTLDTTASSENLSAKYKYPNVHQSTSQMPAEPNGDEPNI
jgi:hypothetical protein